MNENESNSRETTIDLLDLGKSLLSHWLVILLVTLAGGILAFLISAFLITPEYTSTTSIYVIPKTTEAQSPTYNDINAGTQLTNDYAALAKSRPVLERVIQELHLQMTPEELSDHISVDIKSDTRILVIHAENTNPHQAQKIADSVREALTAQIIGVMGVDNVTTVESANFPDKPSSPHVLRDTILGALAAFIIVIFVYIVYYIHDDTIKTPEDVEKHLGLTVLAQIPMEGTTPKEKNSKRKRK